MFGRIGFVVLSVAASAIVVGGSAAAQNGCASAQPTWGFRCVPSASNVTLASCLKDAPLWSDRAQCVPRDDGSGRYDLWVP
ncbi:hypothetical protein ACFVVM_02055 [Nocardia sp. NPDC058176]|uniref:hypothetical protein n=1 Tax=Nocardia sp. NPDC058176 TaxID=3346368 RepID=UPI0036DB1741